MKLTIVFLLASISFTALAQKKLPVIVANSKSAKIYEEGNSVSTWGINPKIALDAYTTNKLTKAKTVKFKTDLDSITFKIKPGEKQDFIVLLNGKDSCLTRIQAPVIKDFSKLKPEVHDSIPFFVNKYNTNLVKIVFNKTDSLNMNFDTGATEMSLTNDVLAKKVKSNPKLYNTVYDIKLGKGIYKSKIYDTQIVGNEADGLMGWDIFDGMVVELNYDKNIMVLHSKMPKQVIGDSNFSKFKIRYINNKPFIESKIVQNGIVHKNWFLFDLGYQRTAMLDQDLLKKAHFPTDSMEVIKKVILHGTHNNEIPVITANLQALQIGPFVLKNVPAHLLGENKPMRGIDIHILGTDVLKRFNTFIDLQKDVIYLAPNHLYDLEYADQKKS
jgi:hypothetical protein